MTDRKRHRDQPESNEDSTDNERPAKKRPKMTNQTMKKNKNNSLCQAANTNNKEPRNNNNNSNNKTNSANTNYGNTIYGNMNTNNAQTGTDADDEDSDVDNEDEIVSSFLDSSSESELSESSGSSEGDAFANCTSINELKQENKQQKKRLKNKIKSLQRKKKALRRRYKKNKKKIKNKQKENNVWESMAMYGNQCMGGSTWGGSNQFTIRTGKTKMSWNSGRYQHDTTINDTISWSNTNDGTSWTYDGNREVLFTGNNDVIKGRTQIRSKLNSMQIQITFL